jgi:hypothetical protein
VALPSSVVRMVSAGLFLKFLSAVLSVLDRLSLGLEALFMILRVSCLASSVLMHLQVIFLTVCFLTHIAGWPFTKKLWFTTSSYSSTVLLCFLNPA